MGSVSELVPALVQEVGQESEVHRGAEQAPSRMKATHMWQWPGQCSSSAELAVSRTETVGVHNPGPGELSAGPLLAVRAPGSCIGKP